MSRPTQEQADEWTILRTEVGSRVLGVSVDSTDDRDLLAIAVEPLAWVVGLAAGLEQPRAWQYRTKPDGVRSEAGDTDLTVHPLRKWMRLALGGNPTVLMSLFAPPEAVEEMTDLGAELRANGQRFRSERARDSFLGYLRHQAATLRGATPPKTNRPELIGQYGFDTKYAYHALRLGVQGTEFLTTGHITLPMSDDHRRWLLGVRTGKFTLESVLHDLYIVEQELEAAGQGVPEHPDAEWAGTFLVNAYRETWLR